MRGTGNSITNFAPRGSFVLGADGSAVLEYYSLHDRESETGAAVTSRKVWFKQTTKICRLDSLPVSATSARTKLRFNVVTRADRNQLRIVHVCERVERVVNQVNKHSFDLFHVEHR
jgi:hypothetical protein